MASSARSSRRPGSSDASWRSPTSGASTPGATRVVTARAPDHTVGVDFDLSTATFRGNQNLYSHGLVLRESRPGRDQRHERLRRRRSSIPTTAGPSASTPARCRPTSIPRSASWPVATTGATTSSSASAPAAQQPRRASVALHRQPDARSPICGTSWWSAPSRLTPAERAVPEPGQLLGRAGSQLHPAGGALRHQPGHHAARRQQLRLHPACRGGPDGQPADAGADRPVRDRRLLLGHRATRRSSASPCGLAPATSSA